jgi:hypothetical protein
MHRATRILERLIHITENPPLFLIPESTVLNIFISICGILVVAPQNNVVGLRHALIVRTSRFAFATAGLSLGSLLFLSLPGSLSLTLTDSNLINEDSFFIPNQPALALWHTRTTCEREVQR